MTAVYGGNADFYRRQRRPLGDRGPGQHQHRLVGLDRFFGLWAERDLHGHGRRLAPGVGTPAGTVTFEDGGATIGSATLSGGQATLTIATSATGFTLGGNAITAVYGGNTDFSGSTSGSVSETVGQAGTEHGPGLDG